MQFVGFLGGYMGLSWIITYHHRPIGPNLSNFSCLFYSLLQLQEGVSDHEFRGIALGVVIGRHRI